MFFDSELKPGDHVKIYDYSTKCYDKKGNVEEETDPRSVQIDSDADKVPHIQ